MKTTKLFILFLILVTATAFTNEEKNTALKKWESTLEGQYFKKWEASPAGKKVYASEALIRKEIINKTNLDGVVSSLSLPAGSRLGYGMMVKIKSEEFILIFEKGKSDSKIFNELVKLKVNDKIKIKVSNASHAPKYAFPILKAASVERNHTIIYKRPIQKGAC